MSTIGHPLSDLINLVTPYFLKDETEVRHLPRFKDGVTPGLPMENDLVRWYAEVSGYDPSPDLTWGTAFGFFRASAICQGIAARWAVRQASSGKAKENAAQRHPMSRLAWKHLQAARKIAKDKAKL